MQASRLGDLLVRAGAISAAQLERALDEQRRGGGRLTQVLVDRLQIPEELIVQSIAQTMGIRPALLAQAFAPAELVERIGLPFMRSQGVFPESYDAQTRTLRLAMVDPSQTKLLDHVRTQTGFEIVPSVGGEHAIQEAVDRLEYATSDVAPRSGAREIDFEAEEVRAPAVDPSVDLVDPRERLQHVLRTQHRQARALRVLVDVLIERGAFTREEYLELLQRD